MFDAIVVLLFVGVYTSCLIILTLLSNAFVFDAIAVLLFVGVYKLSHHFYSIVNCVHAQIIWHCTEEQFATYGPLFIMQIMKDYDEVSIEQASDPSFVPTSEQMKKAYINPSSMGDTCCASLILPLHLTMSCCV